MTTDASGQSESQLTLEIDQDTDGETAQAALASPAPVTPGRPPGLQRVWLKRFKQFEDFTLELGRFNVLVGANNSGKSTLLQAIDLLHSLLKLHREGDRLATAGRYVPAGVLPVASIKDLFWQRQTRSGNDNLAVTIGAEYTDGTRVEFGIRHLFGNMNAHVTNHNGIEGERLDELIGHRAVWVPSSVGIVPDEEYRTAARRTSLIFGGRHNEVLRNLLFQLKDTHSDRFDQLIAILEERFGARLEDVGFDETQDEYVRADFASGTNVRHDLYSAGSGFIQVVQLLAFVMTQSPSIVLLDEPDAHLHSSLQRAVIEILEDIGRDEGYQIVIATHSKEIINFIDPSRLIFVRPGDSSSAPMSEEVTPVEMLRSLGAVDSVDAVAIVRNRRCLFVEGISDVSILGRFAASLGNRALTGDDRVVVVSTGGADRFGHVEQLDVFEQMLGTAIASLEIRDRDGRIDEHREEVITRATRDLHLLERDSIESYLLVPVVIARVIREVASERSRQISVTPDEIEATLLELTDDMRQAATDRIADRYTNDRWHLASERASVSIANEKAREYVDTNWSDLTARLRVVSGKKLLSSLRAWIQLTYSVNFGNERLAEGFAADDIPGEIKDILDRVSALVASP
ncbi:MAG: ATP-dependent nuclease [Solirubrobacteraceae bacterium]